MADQLVDVDPKILVIFRRGTKMWTSHRSQGRKVRKEIPHDPNNILVFEKRNVSHSLFDMGKWDGILSAIFHNLDAILKAYETHWYQHSGWLSWLESRKAPAIESVVLLSPDPPKGKARLAEYHLCESRKLLLLGGEGANCVFKGEINTEGHGTHDGHFFRIKPTDKTMKPMEGFNSHGFAEPEKNEESKYEAKKGVKMTKEDSPIPLAPGAFQW